jgi:ABC-type phosphate transport system permease subunit
VILAVMITPIMVALIAGALASVPAPWREGSVALGVNRWRTVVRVSLRTARPAIVAATVLATARALGEAIMLSMVSGGRGFAANPLDGVTFLFEPVRPLAATIVQESEGLTIGPLAHTVYAMAAVLLVSAAMLSLAGWAAKQPLKRFGIRA